MSGGTVDVQTPALICRIEADVATLLAGPKRVTPGRVLELSTFRSLTLQQLRRLPGFPSAVEESASRFVFDRRSVIKWLRRPRALADVAAVGGRS